MSEHKIQNEGRNALARPGVFCTRTNVGKGWTGNDVTVIQRPGIVKLLPGDVVIRNGRPFDTGLPVGFSDTFGAASAIVTPQMVGDTIAVPFFVEYKAPGQNPTGPQSKFLAAMQRLGARAGVARTADEAVAIALGNVA